MLSHFKFDFNAVKGGWVNSNLVYHRIGEIDPTMAETWDNETMHHILLQFMLQKCNLSNDFLKKKNCGPFLLTN